MDKPKFTRAGIWAIMEAAGMDRSKAASLTNQVIAALAAAIGAGQAVKLRGLGTFEPRERKAYKAHNPRSMDPVNVPARHSVFFKPCGSLKAAMNRRGEHRGNP
jgi:DNA-binding protein HU-beta